MRAEAETYAAETRRAADEDALRIRTEAADAAEQVRSAADKDAEERTARADERVGRLEAKEAAARERISTLRAKLMDLTTQLETLEGEAGSPVEENAATEVLAGETEEVRLEAVADEPAGRAP